MNTPSESDPRRILHVDMDAYFASVELLGRRELHGKPVIIAGASGFRSVVTSCTYEARKYGVHAGMPVVQAVRLAPDVVVLSGEFSRYTDYSRRIFAVLLSFTPMVEPASIDEAFMDVTEATHDILSTAKEVQKAVYKETSLWCTVGCGSNKLLAKMASNFYKPAGVGWLSPSDIEEFPVRSIWGVGPATSARLEMFGIDTIGKLRSLSRQTLRSITGSETDKIHTYAMGIDSRPVRYFDHKTPPKSIGHEYTFSLDVFRPGDYMPALAMMCQKTAYRARESGWLGRVVTLKYRLRNMKRVTRRSTLPSPTDQDQTVLAVAERMATKHINSPIRLIGVSLSQLVPADRPQLSFFPEKTSELNRVADSIRRRYGEKAVLSGRTLGFFRRER